MTNEVIEVTKDEQIKGAILDAAQKLFQQYGLSKTTMEDIAREVGKGKSSLYYYYPNKDEIFLAVLQKEKDGVMREMHAAVDKEESAERKLYAFAHTKYRALRKRRVLYKVMSQEMPQNFCLVKDVRHNYNNQEMELIRNILDYGIERGEFKKVQHDLDIVSYITVSALRGLEFDAIINEGRYTSVEDATRLIEVATDMLLEAFRK